MKILLNTLWTAFITINIERSKPNVRKMMKKKRNTENIFLGVLFLLNSFFLFQFHYSFHLIKYSHEMREKCEL